MLTKAVQKAIDNGWEEIYPDSIHENQEEALGYIFSHEFAKAFWNFGDMSWPMLKGEGRISGYEEQIIPSWKFHLQQMVISEDPIQYLEKFL